MGSISSKILYGRDPSEVCKVTGLCNREKDLIRGSWSSFQKNKNHNATILILKLFQTSEGAQDLFPKFRGMKIEELEGSVKIRAHGLRVIAALNSVVENLDDIECLLEMLNNIAQTHHGREVTTKHFQDLGGVVIATFEEVLANKFTEDMKNAWVKAYGVILSVIGKEYDVIEGNANEPETENANKEAANGDVPKKEESVSDDKKGEQGEKDEDKKVENGADVEGKKESED